MAVRGDPVRCVVQVLGPEPAFPCPAVSLRGYEPSSLEYTDVLEDARQGHVEGIRQFAEGRRAVPEALEDLSARRIGQRGKRSIERTRLYHEVKCNPKGTMSE
jgi:hypothetical protein